MEQTGWVTLAERPPDAAAYPGALPHLLVPASVVFVKPRRRVGLDDPYQCRRYRPAARMAQPVDTSTSHLGFRCIVRAPEGTSR